MGWTKRDIIGQAFEELGLGDYIFDVEASRLQSAMRRLDVMVARWSKFGISTSYPLPTNPNDGDLDDDTTLADTQVEAAVLLLALRLAPSLGKTPMQDTRARAKEAWNTLLMDSSAPSERQLADDAVPAGAGNRPKTSPFLDANDEYLSDDSDLLAVD
jgi:hypothetical protein